MNASFDPRLLSQSRARTKARRATFSLVVPILLLALAAAGAAYFTGLWPQTEEVEKPSGPPPGYISVPISATDIPEYTKVVRDHLWNRNKREMSFLHLPAKDLSPGIKTSVADVIGRVLRRAKREGYVFTEDDFYPPGTRPGIVAGIPAGRRALRLDATKVEGVAGLVAGDVFDMVATIPVEAKKIGQLPVGGHLQSQMSLQAEMSNWSKQATVRVVIQEGTIVSAMAIREVPISNQTFGRGRQRATIPVQEIVLAVRPEEVAPVTEALAVEAKLMVVPHSGVPHDGSEATVQNRRPWTPFEGTPTGLRYNGIGPLEVVETITGAQRQMTAVPGQ